jgi:hypothetical protein
MRDVAPKDYRDAMACLGAAVSIVTTDGGAAAPDLARLRFVAHRRPADAAGLRQPQLFGLCERDAQQGGVRQRALG